MTLHLEKTKLNYALEDMGGFDFLGFLVGQYPVGKYASNHGFKVLIKPSEQSQTHHVEQLKQTVSIHKAVTQTGLICHLNLVIVGWCQYYSTMVSKAAFAAVTSHLFGHLLRWAKHRHSNLNSHQIVLHYWLIKEGGGWVFQSREGLKLRGHAETPIRRHVKVKANRSLYDGDWLYWSKRLGNYPGLAPFKAKLLKQQSGKCAYCELHFFSDDSMEVHHQDGNHDNSSSQNLRLLHRHCRDQVHGAE